MKTPTLLAVLAVLAPAALGQVPKNAEQAPPYLRWHKVMDGPQRATELRQAPGDDTRWFVGSTREGVYVIKDGQLLAQKFLDLSAVLHPTHGFGGLAFHPDYETNGRFYVTYQDVNLLRHLVEYTVSGDPDVADAGSAVDILDPLQAVDKIHFWNQLHFGTDGMLYAALGDGNTGLNLSQDLGSIQGKILRLDVDSPPDYIPQDNPFVGVSGAREEIWHWGLRQVWKFCFDPVTQDMYMADVGRQDNEEIDFAAAGASGLNYGWRCMEGTLCVNGTGCNQVCDDPSWVDPIHEYGHDGRCAIIGGYVYSGSIQSLVGAYFFNDWCTSRFWTLRYDGASVTELIERTDEIAQIGGRLGRVATYGVDHAGELYVVNYDNGNIFKLEQTH